MAAAVVPSVPDLCECLTDLVEWEDFAQYLPGIEQADISIIQKNKQGDVIGQKRALYEKWLQVHPNASWDDVVKALENPAVRQNRIAQRVRENYITSSTITSEAVASRQYTSWRRIPSTSPTVVNQFVQAYSRRFNRHTESPPLAYRTSTATSTNNNTPPACLQHSSSMTDVAVNTSVPVSDVQPSRQSLKKKGKSIFRSVRKLFSKSTRRTMSTVVNSHSVVAAATVQSSDESQLPVYLAEPNDEYEELVAKLHDIAQNVVNSETCDRIQDALNLQCGLPPLPQKRATVDAVFTRVMEQCSILNFHVLEFIVKNPTTIRVPSLEHNRMLQQLTNLKHLVQIFKSSANMVELVTLIKSKQNVTVVTPTGRQKRVELKVQNFWSNFTYEQFEIIVNEIFQTLYNIMMHITVKPKGCSICLNWIIPDIDTTELVPVLPLELIQLIGVIYLHIGSKTIYHIEGDGCESIKAAMLQAIELKNTRAIELLLAVGCSLQVATYTDTVTVTNIVNIKAIESAESSSGSSGGVDHVCILGHNKHVEAIIDPSSEFEPECSSCSVNKKMNKQLHQEVESLRNNAIVHLKKIEEFASENVLLKVNRGELAEERKLKDAEIVLLKRTNERLIKEVMLKDESSSIEVERLHNELNIRSLQYSKTIKQLKKEIDELQLKLKQIGNCHSHQNADSQKKYSTAKYDPPDYVKENLEVNRERLGEAKKQNELLQEMIRDLECRRKDMQSLWYTQFAIILVFGTVCVCSAVL